MTASLKLCPKHGYYAAGFVTCPECDMPHANLSTGDSDGVQVVTVVRRKQSRAKAQKQPTVGTKPLSDTEVNKRLQAAGLLEDTQLADGLATGATVNALYADGTGDSEQVFLAYMDLVDRLASERRELARFRYRLVSGIAA
jgi:hypothetical protein